MEIITALLHLQWSAGSISTQATLKNGNYAMIKYKTYCQYRKENQQFSNPQAHFTGGTLVLSM